MKKGSGKQVLLKLLYELSTKQYSDVENFEYDYENEPYEIIDEKVINNYEEIKSATNRMKAGLLVHGSTSPDSHELIKLLKWGSSIEDGLVWRQGIATKKGNVFMTDVFEAIWGDEELKARVTEKFKQFNDCDYESIMNAMWLVLSATQMLEEFISVETDEEIDLDQWVDSQLKSHKWYFFDKKHMSL